MSTDSYMSQDLLAGYLKRVWEYPMLSLEEEKDLITRYQKQDDPVAAERLITSHLKLVVKVATGSKGYGLPLADLISEGSVGLLMALDKFQTEKEARLSTYAMWWIKAQVNDFILKNWSVVPLGTVNTQRKLFFCLNRIKRELAIYDQGELTKDEAQLISEKTSIKAEDVQQFNRRLARKDYSLNMPVIENGATEHIDLIPDNRLNAEDSHCELQQSQLRKEIFGQALHRLQDRDREIIKARYLEEKPTSLKELGQRYGVSSERIRQLEVKALEKVTSFVERHSLFSQLCYS